VDFKDLKISWEHILELYWKITYRRGLLIEEQLKRFKGLSCKYTEICALFLKDSQDLNLLSEGYDWGDWTGEIRQSFKKEVPLGFLAHPTLVKTMVLARRGGVGAAESLIKLVVEVFGEKKAKNLLKEDYIGLPTIQNLSFMTSANRSRLVNHLAHYTIERKRTIWDSASLVEWGGGYGSLARVIRKMNPLITYIIIDLPELLALQYVYLASIEGEENIHLAIPKNGFQILPGKVNLISSHMVLSEDIPIKCEAFVSTWAITESSRVAQEYVMNNKCFGAKSILLGFKIDEHNFIVNSSFDKPFRKVQVPFYQRLGKDNEYWFL
jgi:hypothetical protein